MSISGLLKSNSQEEFLSELAIWVANETHVQGCDLFVATEDHFMLVASSYAPEMVGRVSIPCSAGLLGRTHGSQELTVAKGNLEGVSYPGYDEGHFTQAAFVPIAPYIFVLRSMDEIKSVTDALSICHRAAEYKNLFDHAFEVGHGFDRLGKLSAVTTTLSRSPYLEEILQLLVNMTAQQFGYRVCTVRLLDERSGDLVLRATQATMPEYQRKRSIKVGESIAGRVVETNEPIVVTDVRTESDYIGHELAEQQGLRSMACVPLSIQDRALGVLTVYADEVREFDSQEIMALQTIAKQASFSIERAKLQVRDTLMQEMHHRVKNNLQQVVSLLRLQLAHKSYMTLDQAINDSIGRILAISAVHDLLSREDLDRVGLKTIAESLIHHLKLSVLKPEKSIAFEVRGEDIQLGMTHATQVALVLNELLHNAIEHGFEGVDVGAIHITVETSSNVVSIWVANNGTPLPEGFESSKHGHLGLQIVHNLASSLRGTFKFADKMGWAVAELSFERPQGE